MQVLENKHFEIHFDEAQGCNIMACFVKQGEVLLPLMPDSRSEACNLDKSSWIMAPYSNRIEDGVFEFQGNVYNLERSEDHSIHGDVRQRPWQVAEKTDTLLRAVFDSKDFDDINWPWSFRVEAVYEIVDNCFQSLVTLTNTSEQVMPAGFGWHPYFSRALTEKDQEIRMQVALEGVYPDDNDNRIPSGPLRDLKRHEDFSLMDVVEPDVFIDGCFYGYEGDGHLYWPGTGLRVQFDCSDACKHLVLYTPLEETYIAFEPVTNANNGVNLLAAGDETAGTVALQPSHKLSAQFDMTVLWD